MIIKRIAINGGIYFDVNVEQQKKLIPLLRPIFRTINTCNTCACNCNTNTIVFNVTLFEMQCLDCFEDWSRGYNLSKEDYKRQAYTVESVEHILNKG